MKKRHIEDEIRKAEKKLTAIKKEVESGKKKKRKNNTLPCNGERLPKHLSS